MPLHTVEHVSVSATRAMFYLRVASRHTIMRSLGAAVAQHGACDLHRVLVARHEDLRVQAGHPFSVLCATTLAITIPNTITITILISITSASTTISTSIPITIAFRYTLRVRANDNAGSCKSSRPSQRGKAPTDREREMVHIGLRSLGFRV